MARCAGDEARRRPTQIPAADVGQLSVLGEHGCVRPDVGDGAAEGAEVRVAGDVAREPRQHHRRTVLVSDGMKRTRSDQNTASSR